MEYLNSSHCRLSNSSWVQMFPTLGTVKVDSWQDYLEGMADSIDVVPIGAYYGKAGTQSV